MRRTQLMATPCSNERGAISRKPRLLINARGLGSREALQDRNPAAHSTLPTSHHRTTQPGALLGSHGSRDYSPDSIFRIPSKYAPGASDE
jgi:hypothetical protein